MQKTGCLAGLFETVRKEERKGIRLSTVGLYREVDGPKTFEELLNALKVSIPEDAVLCIEGDSPDAEMDNFIVTQAVPEVSPVAAGPIRSGPKIVHVPATGPF